MTFLTRNLSNHVLTLTMSSPDTRNALTGPEQFEDFERTCNEINDNKAIRAVVLTGEGSAFCAGGNVKDMRDRTGLFSGDPYDQADSYRRGIQRIPRAIYALNVPIIAAVNGPAVGAGCDLATMCDIRIASEKAMFAESFVKLGIIPGDGGSWFLPKIIGLSRAAEMILTCDVLDAKKALNWGLVSQVVKNEELIIQAKEIANKIASQPPEASRRAKRLLRMSQNVSLDNALEMAASQQSILQMMDDHREALDALIEKRQPKYTNS